MTCKDQLRFSVHHSRTTSSLTMQSIDHDARKQGRGEVLTTVTVVVAIFMYTLFSLAH